MMCEQKYNFNQYKNERGGTMVETAIVFVVLFSLLLGSIDFGIVLIKRLLISHAYSRAVRAAAIQSNNCLGTATSEYDTINTRFGNFLPPASSANFSVNIISPDPNLFGLNLAGNFQIDCFACKFILGPNNAMINYSVQSFYPVQAGACT